MASTQYLARIARLESYGLSHAAARGHAKPGEVTARELREATKDPEHARQEALGLVAFNAERRYFADQPVKELDHGLYVGWDPERARDQWRGVDRQDLIDFARMSRENWVASASYQYEGNLAWYHYAL